MGGPGRGAKRASVERPFKKKKKESLSSHTRAGPKETTAPFIPFSRRPPSAQQNAALRSLLLPGLERGGERGLRQRRSDDDHG